MPSSTSPPPPPSSQVSGLDPVPSGCTCGPARKLSLAVLSTKQSVVGSSPSPASSTLDLGVYIQGLDDPFPFRSDALFKLSDLLSPSAVQDAIACLLPSIVPTSRTSSGTQQEEALAQINRLLPRILSSYTHQAVLAKANAEVVPPLVYIDLHVQLPPEDYFSVVVIDEASIGGGNPPVLNGDNFTSIETRSCPLCLADYTFSHRETVVSTPCFHLFHQRCISGWFKGGGHHCPVCHHSILEPCVCNN